MSVRVLALMALQVTTSCVSFDRSVAEHAVEYNKTVEAAHNNVLLLNILRAMHRHPMYFTALSQVRGNLRVQAGSGSDVPFGGGGDEAYAVSPNASVASNPTFDIAVLDSEGFVRGITQQVSMETIHHYWSQGWPKEMLLHLLIRRIEHRPAGSPNAEVYRNYPTTRESFDGFQDQIRKLLGQGLRMKRTESQGDLLATFPLLNSGGISGVVSADKEGLIVKPVAGGLAVYKKKTAWHFEFDDSKESESGEAGVSTLLYLADESPDVEGSKDRWSVSIRSPEGILYYLGEVARARFMEQGAYTPEIRIGADEKEALFKVDVGQSDDPLVAANYRGQDYYIAEEGAGNRAMHCLSFVSQILALYKSSDQLPTTNAVSIVNSP